MLIIYPLLYLFLNKNQSHIYLAHRLQIPEQDQSKSISLINDDRGLK